MDYGRGIGRWSDGDNITVRHIMRYMRISKNLDHSISTLEAASPDICGETANLDEERAGMGSWK